MNTLKLKDQDQAYDPLLQIESGAALANPDFRQAVCKCATRALRVTVRVGKKIGIKCVRAWRYLKRKNIEAIEIHNRAQVQADERFQRNWYHTRGM